MFITILHCEISKSALKDAFVFTANIVGQADMAQANDGLMIYCLKSMKNSSAKR